MPFIHTAPGELNPKEIKQTVRWPVREYGAVTQRRRGGEQRLLTAITAPTDRI